MKSLIEEKDRQINHWKNKWIDESIKNSNLKKSVTFFDDVKEWHKEMNLPHDHIDYDEMDSIWSNRVRLILEELSELAKAISLEDWVEIYDGLADLTFVVLGASVDFDVPFNEVWDEVKRSNNSKVGGKIDPGGKLIKPETYSPPDIQKILNKKFDKEPGVGRYG